MAIWPASLPPLAQMEEYQRTPDAGTIRTSMDAGPAFQRQRFTAVSETITGTLVFNKTDRDTFWAFFKNTLSYGALSFTEEDPVGGASEQMVFIADRPPQEGGNGVWFKIAVQIEVLP